MKILGTLIYYPLLFISIVLTLLLVISGWSGYLPVKHFPILSLAGMAFPAILSLNILALVSWLVFHPRTSLLHIAALLLTIQPALTYSPLNFKSQSHECEADEIRFLSYNTYGFGLWKNGLKGPERNNPILQYLEKSEADVICLQECDSRIVRSYIDGTNNVMPELSNIGETGNKSAVILSRWPIIQSDEIKFEESYNGCLYCRILIGNDTLAIYNCHFQSFGLSQDEIDEYNHIITHPQDYEEYRNSKSVLKKLMAAGIKRAEQVDAIAGMLEKETARYVILCGDFNDTPLSYAHHRIARLLTDAYRQAGTGPGISYNRNRLYFRIDHVFCGNAITPLKCKTDRSIKTSDHYPVIAHLKLQK